MFKLAYVPGFEVRKQNLPRALSETIIEQNPQVIFLQELWNIQEAELFASTAKNLGFRSYSSHKDPKRDSYGLQVLVSSDFTDVREYPIEDMSRPVTDVLAGLKRGVQILSLTHKTGKRWLVLNSHFAFSPLETSVRLRQSQMVSQIVGKLGPEHDYILFAADTNSSDRFRSEENAVASNWYKDKMVPLSLVEANQSFFLRDTYASLHVLNGGFTQDPTANELTRFSKTTKDEPAQRLDYVYIGSSRGADAFAVTESRLVFDQPLKDAQGQLLPSGEIQGGNLFPSDHFGVESTIIVPR